MKLTKPAILGRSLAPLTAPIVNVTVRFNWSDSVPTLMPTIFKLSAGDAHLVVHGAN